MQMKEAVLFMSEEILITFLSVLSVGEKLENNGKYQI